ncbi:hypothetical protein F441_05875 [Phytophthora nicotianae CJ01A1]|nr:hypothetical protein L915_05742 [Phytophthora nicotianae]ETP20400.1 hypothetical protein F441_05875 [Phytophthora nicotianae CJ01A1]
MSDQVFHIDPPPEKNYLNHDAAESALHAWTRSNGFNVSRRRIRKNDNGEICIRNYECDRAGKPKCTQKLAAEDRVRIKRGSKRCGCPMRISLRAIDKNAPAGEWAIVHTGNGSAVHNHKPSMDARVHAAHRSRAAQDIIATSERSVHSTIEAQSAAGVPVANIYATMLNHDPNTMLLPKDIANAKD